MGGRKLELIHVIFRHGERTPDDFTFYKEQNETKYNDYYPYGAGQLTNKGKKEMYELGKALRQKYNEFLGETFLPNHVDAWSSEFDRTKASLMLVLAGLYPPKEELIWNDELLWQPIPMKYIPVHNDVVLLGIFNFEYRQTYNEHFKKSASCQKILVDYKEVLEYIKKHSGLEIYDTLQAYKLYDCLCREKIFNISPEWATDYVMSNLRELSEKEQSVMTETTDLKRFISGYLLEKIVHDSRQVIQGVSKRRIHIYSGHDVNVMGILHILDVMKPHFAKEGSCVVIELYSSNKGYEVQVKYRSSIGGSFEAKPFPGGQLSFPFERIEDQLKKYGPKNSIFVAETRIADRIFTK